MAQVGHISPEMTRYYTHLGSGVKHDLVNRVQQLAPGLLAALKADS